MRPVSPEARRLAEHIVARESTPGGPDLDFALALGRLVARLSAGVERQLGARGFGLLVSRSLELAKAKHPWLGHYQRLHGPGGEVSGEAPPEVGPAEADAALVEVVARFVWLLETFLGPDLTRRMLGECWADQQPEETHHDRI
ncbi:MAG: hypothetical protein HY901_37890 [Deltaproteobacteria bacterium]|nr:hypothetical protein [Deltaproteobacteria bacterium]